MLIPSQSMKQVLAAAAVMVAATAADAGLRVKTEQANLRSGPAVTFHVTSVAQKGEPLAARRYEAGYVQVARPNGNLGWIHAASQGWMENEIRSAMAETAKGPASSHTRPLSSSAQPAPSSPAQVPADGGISARTYALNLENLGFQQGHYFEGAYGTHSKDFFFPLPQSDGESEANLRVYFRASPMLTTDSTLRVDINGKPIRLVSLEHREQPTYLDIPLPADVLGRDMLRVTIKAALLGSENRCFDERKLALHYVHIQPQTGLTLKTGQTDSLAVAWTTLPSEVRIGMPKETTPTAAATMLQTGIWLLDMGRKISYVPYPQPADIVIGSEAELGQRFPGTFSAANRKDDGSIALARDGSGHPVILISDHPAARPLAQRPFPWSKLLKGQQYRHGPADTPRRNGGVVDLIVAGLGDTQFVSRTIDWSVDLAPPLVPPDRQLDTLVLNVVSTPYAENSQQLLQVYLNGMLQEVRALERDGKPHTLRFKLDSSLQRAGLNKLRIAVQRADSEGECQGNKAAFPVQLLPGSRVELANAKVDPVFFNDLRAYLAGGADIYLTPDGRANLARELALLSAVFSNLGLNTPDVRLQFLGANDRFKPENPFVLLGRGATPDKAALRFDRGRAMVVDGDNRTLMDLDRLPAIGSVQIVTQNDVKGMWLMAPTSGGLPDAGRLHLDRDNLAFIDDHGVSFTVDSREPAVARTVYPDYGGWREWFSRYRFWLVALGWTLVIAIAVALYRKSRQHNAS